MARKKKIEIFKLEDRVLFEAAGAVEAIAAESLAEDANPDQQNEISESERQEKEAQSVAKDAGPATVNEPGKTVQEVGGGLFQKKSEQQNPNQALPDDHVVFSGVTDPNDAFSTAISNFLNTDFSEQPYSADASASSDADASDTRELLILDAETARDFNRDLLPENTEILVLDNDSDAAEQVDSFLESGDTKYDSIKVVGDADLDTDVLQSHLTEHGELVLNAALDFEVPADYADDPFHDTVIHPEVNENITIDAVEAEQLDPALAADVAEDRNELVIINSNIAEKETVLSQLGDGYEVLEIDPSQDAMSQIQDYLDTHSDTKYDAVHVLTHGNDQGFYLGSTKVTDASQMDVFSGHMADNGDFMLYGCNLASSERGQALIQNIADFTGCDVAASINTTGVSGDWSLEYNVGVIESASISISSWNHDLATITVNNQATWDKALADYVSGDTIEITVAGDYQIASNYTFEGYVTISATDLSSPTTITINSGVTVNFADYTSGSSIYTSGLRLQNISITNHGTLNLNDSFTQLTIFSSATSGDFVGIQNNGTLNIGSGNALYVVGSTSGQVTAVSNAGNFNLNNGYISQFSGAVVNFTALSNTAGTATISGNASLDGLIDISGGILDLSAMTSISGFAYGMTASGGYVVGDVVMTGGVFQASGTTTFTGNVTLSSTVAPSTITGGSFSGITNAATLDITGDVTVGNIVNTGTLSIGDGGTTLTELTVNGTIYQNSGSLTIHDATLDGVDQTSTGISFGGGTFTADATTIQNFQIGVTVAYSMRAFYDGTNITFNGSNVKDAVISLTVTNNPEDVNNGIFNHLEDALIAVNSWIVLPGFDAITINFDSTTNSLNGELTSEITISDKLFAINGAASGSVITIENAVTISSALVFNNIQTNITGTAGSLTITGAGSLSINNNQFRNVNGINVSSLSSMTMQTGSSLSFSSLNSTVDVAAIYNSGTLTLTGATVSADTGSRVIGVWVDDLGTANVSGSSSISGSKYSVLNYNSFTMSDGTLDGEIYTVAKSNTAAARTTTTLTDVSIDGSISAIGTTNVYLTNILFTSSGNSLNNYGASDIYVDGTFQAADGSRISINAQRKAGDTNPNNIGGTIRFGSRIGVEFNANTFYSFINNNSGSRMEIMNYSGLSNATHAVTIINGTAGRDNSGSAGLRNTFIITATASNTPLYVTGTSLVDVATTGVRNFGIVNYENMTLTNVNVVNLNQNSAAVTNKGGYYIMTGGSLQGTHSGLDNVEYVTYSTVVGDPVGYNFYFYIPKADLTNVTKIAGQVYAIRNYGELNLANTNGQYTLITADLDADKNFQKTITSYSSTPDYYGIFNQSLSMELHIYANTNTPPHSQAITLTFNGSSRQKFAISRAYVTAYTTRDHISFHRISADDPVTIVTLDSATADAAKGNYGVPDSPYLSTLANGIFNAWYANGYILAEANVDHVRFSTAKPFTTTGYAMYNGGYLTVTNIDSSAFSGYDIFIRNLYDSEWMEEPARGTVVDSMRAHADVEFGLSLAASQVINGAYLTLRAQLNGTAYDGDIVGQITVASVADLTLVNVGVENLDGTALVNYGKLTIQNDTSAAGQAVQIVAGQTGLQNVYGIENHGLAVMENANIIGQTHGLYNAIDGAARLLGGSIRGTDGAGIYNLSSGTQAAIVIQGTGERYGLVINWEAANTTNTEISGGNYGIYNQGKALIYNSFISAVAAGTTGTQQAAVYNNGGSLTIYQNPNENSAGKVTIGTDFTKQLLNTNGTVTFQGDGAIHHGVKGFDLFASMIQNNGGTFNLYNSSITVDGAALTNGAGATLNLYGVLVGGMTDTGAATTPTGNDMTDVAINNNGTLTLNNTTLNSVTVSTQVYGQTNGIVNNGSGKITISNSSVYGRTSYAIVNNVKGVFDPDTSAGQKPLYSLTVDLNSTISGNGGYLSIQNNNANTLVQGSSILRGTVDSSGGDSHFSITNATLDATANNSNGINNYGGNVIVGVGALITADQIAVNNIGTSTGTTVLGYLTINGGKLLSNSGNAIENSANGVISIQGAATIQSNGTNSYGILNAGNINTGRINLTLSGTTAAILSTAGTVELYATISGTGTGILNQGTSSMTIGGALSGYTVALENSGDASATVTGTITGPATGLGTAIVNEGNASLNFSGTINQYETGISNQSTRTLTISGGNINASRTGIDNISGVLTVTGGTISASASDGVGIVNASGATLNINATSGSIRGGDSAVQNSGIMNISTGTFQGGNNGILNLAGTANFTGMINVTVTGANAAALHLSGGSVTLNSGFQLSGNGAIGILNDQSSTLNFSSGKIVVDINGNGFNTGILQQSTVALTISGSAGIVVKSGGIGLHIDNNAVAVMTGGTISAAVNANGTGIVNDGTLTYSGGSISKTAIGLQNNDTATISGGSILANGNEAAVKNAGTLTVVGGIITASQTGASGIWNTGTASKLTLDNSTNPINGISGNSAAIRHSAGLLTLTAGTTFRDVSLKTGTGILNDGNGSYALAGTLTGFKVALNNTSSTQLTLTTGSFTGNAIAVKNSGSLVIKGDAVTQTKYVMNGNDIALSNSGTAELTYVLMDGISATAPLHAIQQSGGTLTMNSSRIQNYNASGDGGAIYLSGGTMNIYSSTINDNAKAIYVSGSTLNIVNSTIAQNTGAYTIQSFGILSIVNGTLINNQSMINNGGEAYLLNSIALNDSTLAPLNLSSFTRVVYSVVADKTQVTGEGNQSAIFAGVFGSNTFDATEGVIRLDTSITDNPAYLGVLTGKDSNGLFAYQINGAWYALNSGVQLSTTVTAYSKDQLGSTRDADAAGHYIMGAVVGGYVPPPVSITVDTLQDIIDAADGKTSLREAIEAILSGSTPENTITFDWAALVAEAGGNDLTISLTLGALQNITTTITIDAATGKAADITITVDGSSITTGSLVAVDNNATLSVNGLNMIGAQNTAGNGGAIAVNSGKLVLNDLTISGGNALLGGAVYLAAGTSMTAGNVTFSSNNAGQGGAVYLESNASFKATDSSFTGNSATAGSGGALFLTSGSTFTGTGVTFSTNTATGDGGAISNAGTVTLNTTSAFTGNTAQGNGGAIANSGTVTVNATSTFTGNTAANGGAIYNNGGVMTIDRSVISHNNAVTNGTAVYTAGGRMDIINSTIAENGKNGSGTTAFTLAADGAASLYLVDSTIADNKTGLSLGSGAGLKYALNSLILNPGNITGLANITLIGSIADNALRNDIFGSNRLANGVIRLDITNTRNPALTGGVLVGYNVAADGSKTYVYTANGTTWSALNGTDAAIPAFTITVDQVATADGRNSIPGQYSMGAVVGIIPDNAIVVTTWDDVVDPDDGKISLREAIELANAAGDGAIIYFNATLIGNNGVIVVNSPLPDVGISVTIDGFSAKYNPNSVVFTIDASKVTTASPLTITSGNVVINNLTFKGGNLSGLGATGKGGMFHITGNADVTLANVKISGGVAAMGGAIYIDTDASVVLDAKTVITKNNAYYNTVDEQGVVTVNYGMGGGIYNAGTLTVNGGVTITNNTTDNGTELADSANSGMGGAIYNAQGATLTVNSATMEVNNAGTDTEYWSPVAGTSTTISGNKSIEGGAIYNQGSATIYLEGNTITRNTATDGGAIYNMGSLTVSDNVDGIHRPSEKIISGNITSGNGGAIYNGGGTLNLSYVTISGNNAVGQGSGLYFAAGSGSVLNSTFAANSGGSAITVADSTGLLLNFVTIALNTNAANGLEIAGGSVTLKNTLVARNGVNGDADVTGTYNDGKGNVIVAGKYSQKLLFGDYTFNQFNDGTIHLNSNLQNPAAVGGVYDTTVVVDQNGRPRYNDGGKTTVGSVGLATKPTTGLPNVVTIAGDIVDDSDGLISLREAIEYALKTGETVYFDFAEIMNNSGTLVLSVDAELGSFALTAGITIDGYSAQYRTGADDVVTVDGSKLADSVFKVTASGAEFISFNVIGGTAASGGAFNIALEKGYASMTGMTILAGGNTVSGNGGLIAQTGGSLSISNSILMGGSAKGDGGAIYFSGSNLSLTNTSVTGNSATGNGGGILFVGQNLTLSGTAISNNTATGSGGGIHFTGNTLTATYSTTATGAVDRYSSITGNQSLKGDGGAVYVGTPAEGSTAITLNGVNVQSNEALQGKGGAFYLTLGGASSFEIVDDANATGSHASNITSNRALNGGAFYLNTTAWGENTKFTLGASLNGNSAVQNGGAIYVEGDLTLAGTISFANNSVSKGNGGALYVTGAFIMKDTANVTFRNNSSTSGGGGALYVEGAVTLTGTSVFTGNTAKLNGGAIYAGGALTVKGASFTGNSAGSGGAIYANSGLTVTTASFSSNTATGNGGAIYIAAGTTATIGSGDSTFVTITGNTALNGGGIYNAGTLTIGKGLAALSSNSALYNAKDKVGGEGGAIYNSGTLTMSWDNNNPAGLNVSGNKSTGLSDSVGGGGFLYNTGDATLSFFLVSNNTAYGNGGAIYSEDGNLSLTGMSFIGNRTTAKGNGGAVYALNTNVTINSSEFTGNSASNTDKEGNKVSKGGALYFSGTGNLTIKSELVQSGDKFQTIATEFNGNSAVRGGGAYIEANGGTVSISNVMVKGNIGVYSTDGNYDKAATYVSQGAGFWIGGSSANRVTVENTTFTGNAQANITWGGGLYVENVGLNLINSTFYWNTANHGGGLYIMNANVSMINTTAAYNIATDKFHLGAGGGGILVTGLNAHLNMLNSVVAANYNTYYPVTANQTNPYFNDIVLKMPNTVTARYSIIGEAWDSSDKNEYRPINIKDTNWGSTNTYHQNGRQLFEFQQPDGSYVVYFGKFIDWDRAYDVVRLNPVYATTATLMIRPDSVAAYKGVYSAINRATGEMYYNTINSSKVTDTNDIGGSWVNFADGSSVTIADGNIVTNGQNGWTRKDQLQFNTYNVGAHALKVMDANYYAGQNYEYNVSHVGNNAYSVDSTVNKMYILDANGNKVYYDAFNPFDGAITLREAMFLAGTTQTRTFYSSNPDVQNLYEEFKFSTNIRFNSEISPADSGNAFNTKDGRSIISIIYKPTIDQFTPNGSDFLVLDSYYGALTFNKAGDTRAYTLAGLGQDGTQLDIVIAGTSGGLLNVVDGSLAISNFTALEGGSASQGGVFHVSGGSLWVKDIAEIHGGSASQGGLIYQSGGYVILGAEGSSMLIHGHQATQGGVIYQTDGILGMTGKLTFVENEAAAGAWIYQTGGLLSSFGINSDGSIIQANIMVADNYSTGGESSLIHQDADGDIQLYNTTIRNTVANEATAGSALFTVNGIFTLLNSTVTNNLSHGAVLSSTGGTIYIANSTVAFNRGGLNVEGVSTTSSTTAADGTVTETTTTKGELFVLNSILTSNGSSSISVTGGVGSSIDYSVVDADPNSIFVMTGGKPLEGPNGTLTIKADGLAGTGGVLVGAYKGEDGYLHFAYKTSANGTWINWASDVGITMVSEVAFGQNGVSRYELGRNRFCIGAYATDGTIIPENSLIVTTGDDTVDPNDGKTSLREALEYAQQIYDETGIVCTITFDMAQIGGDTVTVDSSLYLNTDVVIQGDGITVQAANTVSGTLFAVTDANLTLTNLSVNLSDANAGAFQISGNGNSVLFDQVNITGGTAANGGAIHNNGANFTLNGGFISGAHAEDHGGAIYNAAGILSVFGTAFNGNTATAGGAIYNAGTLNLNGAVFNGNTATGNGGAVSNSGSLSVVDSTFSDNNAANGGAISNSGSLTVSGSMFESNIATGSGGAIDNAGSLSVSDSAFDSNSAGTTGGAISTNGVLTVTGGFFSGNTATENGGAIYGNAITTADVDFSDNSAMNGGAIYGEGMVTVNGGTFERNTAIDNGGAVYLDKGGMFENITLTGNTAQNGAAVYSNSGILTIDSAMVTGNTAGNGSIIVNHGNQTVIENSSLNNNIANDNAVNADGELFLISTTIAENSRVAGADVSGKNVTIVNSTIAEAGKDGVLVKAAGDVQLANSIVVGKEKETLVIDAAGKVDGAYSVVGRVNSGSEFNNEYGTVTTERSYGDVFGKNTVNSNGLISLPSGSPAAEGVWTAVDTTADSDTYGNVYYTTRPEGMWTQGYNPNRMNWNLLGAGAIGGRGDISSNAAVVGGTSGGYPSMGSSWNLSWAPDFGPGTNNSFIDPSFNGIGWDNSEIYNVVADNLITNSGFLLNFRNEMPAGSRWYYDFTHAFDDRYSSMERFSVTQGRFDLGSVPSGETYISVNVNGNISDDFTRYTTTPYLSDGTPLIPAELESMNPKTTAPAEEVFTFPADLEEKVMSYLRRAEIFKDDYDKALDSFLKV